MKERILEHQESEKEQEKSKNIDKHNAVSFYSLVFKLDLTIEAKIITMYDMILNVMEEIFKVLTL